MCEACSENRQMIRQPLKRRRLWEMTDGWHCSIIGTCLTLSDLRGLGRKLHLSVQDNFPEDYQLHGFFVAEASKDERAGKLLGKLLDKRHARAITRARALKNDEDITAFWDAALEAGDIPGPYWALLSHPLASSTHCERMFADVHMLSHLVGASNRADIRKLQELENENESLRDRLRRVCRRHRDRLAAKNQELQEMAQSATAARTDAQPIRILEAARPQEMTVEPSVITDLKRSVASAQEQCDAYAQEIAGLRSLVARMQNEQQAFERALGSNAATEAEACQFNLDGQCLLYVGGRKSSVCRLKALVEAWNGEFVHHDGGIERSVNELAGAVARADTIVFPTDCISHEAALMLKKLCRDSMKPYVPLRTTGAGALIAGLQGPHVDTPLAMMAE